MLRTNLPSIAFQSTPQRIRTCQQPLSLALQHCVHCPQNSQAIPLSTRLDNAQPGAGTLTQRHGRLIGTEMHRVESIAGLTKGAAGLMAWALRSRESLVL
jgi:hypothetical protein